MPRNTASGIYAPIIERIFFNHYREGDTEVSFTRAEIEETARDLDVQLPKNLGDVIYSFRFRRTLPEAINQTAPEGRYWIIRLAGRGRYKFELVTTPVIVPSDLLSETKVPDATPGVISRYALDDEQALLAKLRYNRLIDIFTGLACYSLQNHLRTYIKEFGQVETDELYIGIDKRGVHYVIPVQVKGGLDKLSIVQIEQDIALCKEKFPELVCRPVASQFMSDDIIALFEFEESPEGVKVSSEKHYRLVLPDDLSSDELEMYKLRS